MNTIILLAVISNIMWASFAWHMNSDWAKECERYKQYREEIDEARKKQQESIYTDATIRKLRYNRLKKMRVIGRKG